MAGSDPGESVSRRALSAFIALSAVYYAFYFAVFAGRLMDYWADILRHFPWARRLLG